MTRNLLSSLLLPVNGLTVHRPVVAAAPIGPTVTVHAELSVQEQRVYETSFIAFNPLLNSTITSPK